MRLRYHGLLLMAVRSLCRQTVTARCHRTHGGRHGAGASDWRLRCDMLNVQERIVWLVRVRIRTDNLFEEELPGRASGHTSNENMRIRDLISDWFRVEPFLSYTTVRKRVRAGHSVDRNHMNNCTSTSKTLWTNRPVISILGTANRQEYWAVSQAGQSELPPLRLLFLTLLIIDITLPNHDATL